MVKPQNNISQGTSLRHLESLSDGGDACEGHWESADILLHVAQ